MAYFYMAESSYYHRKAVVNKLDKYLPLRAWITLIFHESRGVYDDRRIHLLIKERRCNTLCESGSADHEVMKS